VKHNLVLWLDAGRQAAAHAAAGLSFGPSGSPVEIAFDGSGLRHHLVQRRAEAQPRLLSVAGHSVFRFDGKDDSLERAGLDLELEEASIFLMLAPATNLGGYRGLLSGNQAGRSDYVSGFTIDLGPSPSQRLESLNVEGKGFGGAVNLLKRPSAFGEFHLVQVVIPPGDGPIATFLDDAPQLPRARRGASMAINELALGARCYSNEPRPVYTQGFLHGDIAEVLVYSRALRESERREIASYLAAKHRDLSRSLKENTDSAAAHLLRTVADPVPVQMLVPGFAVRELPLSLTNINNVRYRLDGKLLALAYDGNIYLLTDRDADGLEDHAELFWDNQGRIQAPIGIALTPPGYWRGNGLFVASKGKCSLIVDTDGDDRADREIVVARGWRPLPHGVDALGVALGEDGSVYFGLGAADYTNAYLVDAKGKAHYGRKSERGTILRVAPDFGTRDIVATGIRFPVGLAFNRQGDLFATDQEGATWLANGNPFDELLHIRPGRHYGFPPRHSRHLPGVIDEPSTFDYKPQHQSTCGLCFNDREGQGAVFGPSWWAGDAIVCGYSRGKLFRTELIKVRGEYVARTVLIGVAGMLPVDACVSSVGALVVATHSGAPDWGSGPDGRGKLFKIAYTGLDQPQPVMAWSSGPREVRVAFDRPLEPGLLHDLAGKTAIEFGAAVAAGDRFETLRPGYAVVAAQLAQPRMTLRTQGVSLAPDRRSLFIQTDQQLEPVSYAVTLPGLGRPDRPNPARKELPQAAEIDLAFDLCGCAVQWSSASGADSWSGWLPSPDLAVSRALTARSSEHNALWQRLEQPGTLLIRTQLRLTDLLRPAVQPGSEIDDRLPPEKATIHFRARGKLSVTSTAGDCQPSAAPGGLRQLALRVATTAAHVPVVITLETGPGALLEMDYKTDEDSRLRALSLSRIFVPWASLETNSRLEQGRAVPLALEGGDLKRGREIFHSDSAQCSKCHAVRGAGGKIGPDLSNLVERDYDSVLRDIVQPSVAINPDYVTYSVALADGRVFSGTVRTEGKWLHIGNEKGEESVVERADVEQMKPQAISIMPEGLPKVLGPERMRDLLTFLLTPPPVPARIHRDDAPPPRKLAEVDSVLKAGAARPEPARQGRPLRVVLVSGAKDHGIDEHDYPLWSARWSSLLRLAENLTVATASDWPSAKELARADVMVWYSANAKWSSEKARDLDAFLARGGGLVVLHYALNGNHASRELAERIGLAWSGGSSKFRHGPVDLGFNRRSSHAITAGFDRLRLVDESYWNLTGDPSRVNVLATGDEEGSPQPLIWTREQGEGRIFCSVLGHYTWTFDDPLFRILILRGICWAAREHVDRLSALATVGAQVEGGSK
jgi:putative heme-binding domain-containing protein